MKRKAELKWGIVGAGKISHDFCQALAYESAAIHAVAASDAERAKKFAKTFAAQTSYGSYQELAKDPEVDVVYIGTVHTQHFAHAKMMLQAGKHVLCEKPLGMNAKEVELLIEEAKQAKKLLIEGIWTRHFPVVKKAREVLDSGELGAVRQVVADFGFVAPREPNHRLWTKQAGGGCLLDIGCYIVAWGTFGCGVKMPKTIAAAGVLDTFGHGVDESASVALAYDDCIATLGCTLRANTPEEAKIICEKGWITIKGPAHCPTTAVITRSVTRTEHAEEVINEPLPVYKEGHPGGCSTNYPNSEGFVYEVRAMQELLSREDPAAPAPAFPLEESLTIAKIIDESLAQVGVKYNF